jgi:hypothetical protein
MPAISRFYGIIISMFYDEHNPPHFHAKYDNENIVIEIQSFRILDGKVSSRALGLITEWASQHQDELMINWENARIGKEMFLIKPL